MVTAVGGSWSGEVSLDWESASLEPLSLLDEEETLASSKTRYNGSSSGSEELEQPLSEAMVVIWPTIQLAGSL